MYLRMVIVDQQTHISFAAIHIDISKTDNDFSNPSSARIYLGLHPRYQVDDNPVDNPYAIRVNTAIYNSICL